MHIVHNQALEGTIAAIPAKAHAHRALIAAALANSPSSILLSRSSKDIDATMASLQALGAHITYKNQVVTVIPGPHPSKGAILPHESGTTLRLLLPVAASICPNVDVDAKGRLPERPMEPLKSQMEAHGISFSQNRPPLTMTGRLQGGSYAMVGNVSSQFFSGLLLAAPQMGTTTIESIGLLQSRDYVTLTMAVMKDFGVTVESNDTIYLAQDQETRKTGSGIHEMFTVKGGQTFKGREDYPIEGDWSNAAIWLVAAGLTGKTITITGLNKDSVQADRRILDIVGGAGTNLSWSGRNLTCSGKAHTPLQVDLEQMPDLLPVLSALACGIKGESAFINGARLRLKECDRLDAVYNMVTSLGGQVRMDGDNIYITGSGNLEGGVEVDCCNDHRLVMAGALASLIAKEPVRLKDSQAISKSYPQFFEDWNVLGGNAHVI